MRSPRTALLAVGAALLVLPVTPAAADHVRFTPPPYGHVFTRPPATPPPPVFGPRVRVRRTVAPGAALLLPRVAGRIRIVCTGPAMRGALVWLAREKDGRTAVRRYDGGREFDVTYRVVRGDVRTSRERCR